MSILEHAEPELVSVPVEITWCEVCDADVARASAIDPHGDGSAICAECWAERPTADMTPFDAALA